MSFKSPKTYVIVLLSILGTAIIVGVIIGLIIWNNKRKIQAYRESRVQVGILTIDIPKNTTHGAIRIPYRTARLWSLYPDLSTEEGKVEMVYNETDDGILQQEVEGADPIPTPLRGRFVEGPAIIRMRDIFQQVYEDYIKEMGNVQLTWQNDPTYVSPPIAIDDTTPTGILWYPETPEGVYKINGETVDTTFARGSIDDIVYTMDIQTEKPWTHGPITVPIYATNETAEVPYDPGLPYGTDVSPPE